MKTRYYFHLFSDILLYSEKQKTSGKFIVHRHIWLQEARFTDIDDDDKFHNVVQVQMPKKSFRLLYDSPEEKAQWLAKIIDAKSKLKSGSGSQELAAIWKQDHESPFCSNCKTKFTFMNRRHHCRSCGDVFCGKCSSHKIVMRKLQSSKPKRACEACFHRILEEERMMTMQIGSTSFRKRDRGTETLHMQLIRELKEYSKNLDACLEVFGRPILDACILWGKEVKKNPLRVLLNESGLVNTLAIFLHSLEEIVYYTDNLVADLEDSSEQDAAEYIFHLGQKLSLFYVAFNEHHIKYAERLPLVQHCMRPGGALDLHVKKCNSSGQLPGGMKIRDGLELPRNRLPRIMSILRIFDKNFRTRKVSDVALAPLQQALSRMFQAEKDMEIELQIGQMQIEILKRQSQYNQSIANMNLRGRMFLMEHTGPVSLNSNPPKTLKVLFFSDSLVFSNKGNLLHKLNFLESLISLKGVNNEVQIVAGHCTYSIILNSQIDAKTWFRKLKALNSAYRLRKEGVEYVALKTIQIRDSTNSKKVIKELPVDSVIVVKKRKLNNNDYTVKVLQPMNGWTDLKNLQGEELLRRNIGEWCAISRQRLHERYNPAYSCDLCHKDVSRICITDNYRPRQLAMQFVSKICTSCRLHCNTECFLAEDKEQWYSDPERLITGR